MLEVEQSPFHGRHVTWGLVDLKSPRANRKVDVVHKAQMYHNLTCRPTMSCSVFENKAYLQLHINPQSQFFEDGTELRSLEPHKLHCTLVVAYLEPMNSLQWRAQRKHGRFSDMTQLQPLFEFWRRVAYIEGSYGRRVKALWSGIETRQQYSIQFIMPPWASSWNFGIDRDTETRLVLLRNVVEQLWRDDLTVELYVRERREVHVSWF